jgi:hypothetical protein
MGAMSGSQGFEPNGTETNSVECDGVNNLAFTIAPAFFSATLFYLHLVLIGGKPAGGAGPIIFYVPPDELDAGFKVPPDCSAFTIPYELGAPR